MNPPDKVPQKLKRKVGVGGAILMGLGSILGTGVFVSVGIGFSMAGWMVLPAILVATCLATLNGLSSAQLAAQHPVSGGTYAYGYRWLSPFLGFSAGILFLFAKSASAATAALGCAIYGLELIGLDSIAIRIGTATGIVVVMTLLVAGGLKRSHWMNVIIVSFTVIALTVFVVVALGVALPTKAWSQFKIGGDFPGFLTCCGLMFVAFTGYGRIATLGEEIVDPSRNIPRAIITTLVISGLLYAAIGLVYVTVFLGAEADAQIFTLKAVANRLEIPWLQTLVAVAAMTAMLGVLLNLLLGLSRVGLAMGRNGDLPGAFGRVNEKLDSPTHAVVGVGVFVAALTLVGDVKLTWSFSAFTVLVYYALTNLAATQLSSEERLYPAFLSWLGLCGCLGLAFFIDPMVIASGSIALLVAGLARSVFRRSNSANNSGLREK